MLVEGGEKGAPAREKGGGERDSAREKREKMKCVLKFWIFCFIFVILKGYNSKLGSI